MNTEGTGTPGVFYIGNACLKRGFMVTHTKRRKKATRAINAGKETSMLENKTVTVLSDLTNDEGYQTASEVQAAISTAVASAYKYKGSVASQSALPANADTGDVYAFGILS